MRRITQLLTWTILLLTGCGQDGGGTTSEDASSGTTEATAPTSAGTSSDAMTTGETGTATTGGDPFTHDPVCSSDEYWTKGNLESPLMHPGMACLTCHKAMEPDVATRFPIVGTIYPTGHEPDDCLGVDGPVEAVVVEVTTADMRVIQLPVNSSGNFRYDIVTDGGAVKFPITARVMQGDRERKMASPQATGDCNSCHSQAGEQGAPGRIVAP